jgi:predicted esterase
LNIEENVIKILKTARYFSNEFTAADIKSVLIVIHGYAQLGKDFINSFSFLDDKKTLIIAPEGLSKFYFRNQIGASWMTKEDRLNEINDYVNYLNSVIKQISLKIDLSKTETSLLGFSQGVHTAVRFFTGSSYNFGKLIICSSDFPKDADFHKLKEKLAEAKMYFVHGIDDEIISHGTYNDNMKLLREKQIDFEEITFNGKHEINKDSILKILNK